MPKRHTPRSGSMQFWPRKRAVRPYPRFRTSAVKDAKPSFFAGYKAGMTHAVVTDNRKYSITKGEDVSIPLTVIECPPLKVAGARGYARTDTGALQPVKDILFKTTDHLKRKRPLAKKPKEETLSPADYTDITLIAHTQPDKTGKKKKPELFEIPLGGSVEEKWTFIKEHKELNLSDVFQEGDYVDIKAVTKGKGFQGPVKRFGINLRAHKSEKTKRGPGSLGPWKGHAHIMYRVPHAGQMGYQQRTEHNKQIMAIGDTPDKINPDGGFITYGIVKNNYLLIKGSVPGPKKRLLFITTPMRKRRPEAAPELSFISRASQQ